MEGATATLASTFLFPAVASADITSKVASSSALRNVKRAQKQLDTLELYVVNDQYTELKVAIREAPLSEVRKAAFTLVRGGEDGPDADKLTASYQKFIASLEKMDSQAGLGMRGRKLSSGELLGDYNDCLKALRDFVLVAEESASIPVQYADDAATRS